MIDVQEGIPLGDLPGADSTGAMSQDIAPAVLSGTQRRVVYDTNILVSLYVFADSRFAPLRNRIEQGAWLALTSDACIEEFRRVLGYPMFGLSPERQAAALTAYANVARRTLDRAAGEVRVTLPRCKDRDDQKFLELARDADADWLVTADKALLKLARRDRLRGLFRILTPAEALAELGA